MEETLQAGCPAAIPVSPSWALLNLCAARAAPLGNGKPAVSPAGSLPTSVQHRGTNRKHGSVFSGHRPTGPATVLSQDSLFPYSWVRLHQARKPWLRHSGLSGQLSHIQAFSLCAWPVSALSLCRGVGRPWSGTVSHSLLLAGRAGSQWELSVFHLCHLETGSANLYLFMFV